jgi:hypothetical protein
LTLGKVRTADEDNEITAIAELLAMLDIKCAITTIEAMGCQRDISAKIVEISADCVLGAKDNQPIPAETVKLWFKPLIGARSAHGGTCPSKRPPMRGKKNPHR